MTPDFHGAVALVTGSGRGLGRMIAETLLAGGADVALHDINEEAPAAFGESESLTALARELSARGSTPDGGLLWTRIGRDTSYAVVDRPADTTGRAIGRVGNAHPHAGV